MAHRRQLSESQVLAARNFQEIFERATLGRLSPADPARVKVDGGKFPDPITDQRMRAAARLRSIEATLVGEYGNVGLGLTRSVLCDGKTVAATARLFGAAGSSNDREVRWWGALFRRCLDVLAKALGLANARRPPRYNRLNGDGTADPALDPARHAGADELADPGLRRGRPNGEGV